MTSAKHGYSGIIDTMNVENVVASTSLGMELDLSQLAMDMDGVDYDPDKFPGLVYRIHDPKAAALIFRSGKVVCTGAESIPAVEEALEHTFNKIASLGLDVDEDPTIHIQNMVASADLGESLNLNAIAIGLGLESVEYEPEQFPGLVYRLDEPDVVVLLFGSGKMVITGGKDQDDVTEAIDHVADELEKLGLVDL